MQNYGTVVGTFDGAAPLGHGNPHSRFEVNAGGKRYEADINTQSMLNPDGSPGGSNVEYAERDQYVSSMPQAGETDGGELSYDAEGLHESDFQPISNEQFGAQLQQLARHADRIALTGKMYHDPGKNGIHDIHMNSGNDDASRDDPGHDGAVSFYTQEGDRVKEQTVFIKFQSQHLAA
jgi:hypothetical protein